MSSSAKIPEIAAQAPAPFAVDREWRQLADGSFVRGYGHFEVRIHKRNGQWEELVINSQNEIEHQGVPHFDCSQLSTGGKPMPWWAETRAKQAESSKD